MTKEQTLINFTGFKLGENPTESEKAVARNLAFFQSRGECLDNCMTSQQALRSSKHDYRLVDIISRMPKWKQFICFKLPLLFKILFPFEFVV
jgi:hypothetical protein